MSETCLRPLNFLEKSVVRIGKSVIIKKMLCTIKFVESTKVPILSILYVERKNKILSLKSQSRAQYKTETSSVELTRIHVNYTLPKLYNTTGIATMYQNSSGNKTQINCMLMSSFYTSPRNRRQCCKPSKRRYGTS
jgi:hypothetical protein